MKKEIQEYLVELLKLINKKMFNFNDGEKASIALDDGELVLWLPIDGRWKNIILDNKYENFSLEDMVDTIFNSLNN